MKRYGVVAVVITGIVIALTLAVMHDGKPPQPSDPGRHGILPTVNAGGVQRL